jgi:hypothetical protein
MTTLRQIQANQRNAEKSTGPTSPRGKEQSRRNALKHGLAGAGIVLPEEQSEAVEHRKAEWHSALRPWNPLEEWLCEEIVVASVQIDLCRAHEIALRTELAERAGTSWDDDRRLAAEILAGGLPRKPALVSRQLQQTPQGCDWMIERWEALARILEAKGDWSEAQKALAMDLLGTPPELRDGPTRLDPSVPDDDVRAHRAAVAAREIARLQNHRDTVLADRDAREQLAAEIGIELDPPRPLSLLRRYTADCQRRFRWALSQLRRRPGSTPRSHSESDSRPSATPEPPAPAPTPPPFDTRLLPPIDDDEYLPDEALLAAVDPELRAELVGLQELRKSLGAELSALFPKPAQPLSAFPKSGPRPAGPSTLRNGEAPMSPSRPRLNVPPTS